MLLLFTGSILGQEYIEGSIITKRYDTIKNVKIKHMNESKSVLHLTYIDEEGNVHKPNLDTIKCYTRGDEKFCRVFLAGEMIMVKEVVQGTKLNLYRRHYNGVDLYYIEKVYDELIKVPLRNGKFKKVIGNFLSSFPNVASKIKTNELSDINEIVKICNES
jgi:hypothetical protein